MWFKVTKARWSLGPYGWCTSKWLEMFSVQDSLGSFFLWTIVTWCTNLMHFFVINWQDLLTCLWKPKPKSIQSWQRGSSGSNCANLACDNRGCKSVFPKLPTLIAIIDGPLTITLFLNTQTISPYAPLRIPRMCSAWNLIPPETWPKSLDDRLRTMCVAVQGSNSDT